MDKKLLILVLFILISFVSCNNKPKDFYSYSRYSDIWRIPLIEPIELISYGGGVKGTWFIDLEEKSPELAYIGIDSVGLLKKDSIYVINSNRDVYIYETGKVEKPWYICKNRKLLKQFQNREEFKKYCDVVLKQNIKISAPEIIFKKFAETGAINWK